LKRTGSKKEIKHVRRKENVSRLRHIEVRPKKRGGREEKREKRTHLLEDRKAELLGRRKVKYSRQKSDDSITKALGV